MPQLSVNSSSLWLLAIRTLSLCPFFSPQRRHYATHISGVLFWTKTGSLTASKAALKSCRLEPWLLFSSCCILEQPHIERPIGLLHEPGAQWEKEAQHQEDAKWRSESIWITFKESNPPPSSQPRSLSCFKHHRIAKWVCELLSLLQKKMLEG